MRLLMAILFSLLLFFSCSSQNKEYISVEQIDSNYPIRIGGDTTINKIYQISFPLVYKIKKNVSENIHLGSSSDYMYNGKYAEDKDVIYSITPMTADRKALAKEYKILDRSAKEYVFWVAYTPDTTFDTQPYINIMKKESKKVINIGSIQELKKTNPAFLEGFLGNDSIAIGYLINEKRNVRYTVLPVEIR